MNMVYEQNGRQNKETNMGNNDKHFWRSRELHKSFLGSLESELKTFLGTIGFINGKQGIN